MTIERAVELFAAIHLTLMGASHMLRHRAWAEFFVFLSRQGRAGVFMHGFLSVFFGSVIVAGHNVWHGPATALTVTGWFYMLKSVHSFLIPEIGVKTLGRVRVDRSHVFVIPGIAMLALGLLSGYCGIFLH